MKNHYAMAPIENDSNYSRRYGPSDLKSDECQFGTLGQFQIAAKIQDGCQSRGNLLVLFV